MKRKRKGEEKRFFSKKNKKTKSPKIFCCQIFFSKTGLGFFRQTPDRLHFNGYHVKNIFSKMCVINDSRRPLSTVWCRSFQKAYRNFTVTNDTRKNTEKKMDDVSQSFRNDKVQFLCNKILVKVWFSLKVKKHN